MKRKTRKGVTGILLLPSAVSASSLLSLREISFARKAK